MSQTTFMGRVLGVPYWACCIRITLLQVQALPIYYLTTANKQADARVVFVDSCEETGTQIKGHCVTGGIALYGCRVQIHTDWSLRVLRHVIIKPWIHVKIKQMLQKCVARSLLIGAMSGLWHTVGPQRERRLGDCIKCNNYLTINIVCTNRNHKHTQ